MSTTLQDQIKQVIDTEPVVVFIKGTPEAPACGNSMRALQALWQAGAPITAVDVLPDPRIRQELTALSEWPTIPQVFVKGELIGGADITEELNASGELRPKIDEALGAEHEQIGAHGRARARRTEPTPSTGPRVARRPVADGALDVRSHQRGRAARRHSASSASTDSHGAPRRRRRCQLCAARRRWASSRRPTSAIQSASRSFVNA